MAQLPPKIPTIPQNWQHFSHQRVSSSSTMSNITSTTTTTTDHQQIPSWIDEFLDFSSVRRGAHRRSASDSIAFLETSFLEEDGKSGGGDGDGDFDRLDDEQLISMFSDNVGGGVSFPPPSTSNPSSPSSDQNSNNNEEKPMAMVLDSAPVHERYLCHEVKPKDEAVEDESSCRIEEEGAAAAPSFAATISCTETVVDPKRVKR